MKEIITLINKSFESRQRLGIMSLLMVHDKIDFITMKELLQLTDGNLATHIAALEKNNYLVVKKSFLGKKTNTAYSATAAGKKAFKDHLAALEKLIKNNK
ncbi:MAG: transcriptional regulator [Chitinophagales bacterium]